MVMVSETAIIVASAIATALFFDFVNGFHDSANSIATVVGTKVLKPLPAVSMAAVANIVGPFIFGTAVARTVGEDVLQPEFSTVLVITAVLVGAIVWDLITWYFGLPTSSSHALIGGLIGSGLVAGGTGTLVWSGVETTLIFIFYFYFTSLLLTVSLLSQILVCLQYCLFIMELLVVVSLLLTFFLSLLKQSSNFITALTFNPKYRSIVLAS
jgi:phosphate/sulfate permease